MPEPTYRAGNVTEAYQLMWSYALFWHRPPADFIWFEPLQAATEPDDIRLLNHRFQSPNVSQFLISTTPAVPPLRIAQRVKGRLQHLLTDRPDAFRRNYSLRSLGSTKRDKVEAYVASQLGHHPLADSRIAARFEEYQISDPAVDLSQPQKTTHAQYWYNLHLVFVMRDRARHVQEDTLDAIYSMIVRSSATKAYCLSRAGILPDHIHLAVGCGLSESPQAIALSYMNNLAFATGVPLFDPGYWVGTFGEYDLGAV